MRRRLWAIHKWLHESEPELLIVGFSAMGLLLIWLAHVTTGV